MIINGISDLRQTYIYNQLAMLLKVESFKRMFTNQTLQFTISGLLHILRLFGSMLKSLTPAGDYGAFVRPSWCTGRFKSAKVLKLLLVCIEM